MMPGIPGGRQFAVSLSSGALYAARFASYSGVSCTPPPRPPPPRPAAPPRGAAPPAWGAAAGGAPAPRPAGAAPRAACPPAFAAGAALPRGAPPPPRSQTPLKSGSFATAAQSAAVGCLVITCCAVPAETFAMEKRIAATEIEKILLGVVMGAKLARNHGLGQALPLEQTRGYAENALRYTTLRVFFGRRNSRPSLRCLRSE